MQSWDSAQNLADPHSTVTSMASELRNSGDELISAARAELEAARGEVIAVDAQIQKKENEIETAMAIGERDVSNLERQVQDAENLDEYEEARAYQVEAAGRRAEQAKEVNELHAKLGELKRKRIDVGATQTALEAKLTDLQGREDEKAQRQSISDDQLRRAAELEDRLTRLEAERGELVQRIEQYAPVVEAHREATAASGSAELSEAYAAQADVYGVEWRRWLKWLGVAGAIAMIGGIFVILLTHPSGDASNSEIVSRIAIEVLVLGLLVYAVRVTAHQFRVHRHLETVARSKASALMTFNRLVTGPGEAEVRTAVAVALAQAVFDPNSTGFMDSSQDGVTIIERVVAPVAQRMGD